MASVTSPLTSARRVVLKIGSALLVDPVAGDVRRDWLAALVADVAALKARGADVLIVSSGSIALGKNGLNLPSDTLKLNEAQAAAAAGQIRLAQAWSEALATKRIDCAQILLTSDDTELRRRYLNARATLETLLKLGVVPIINENDTVATSEIRFGDNDRLAARVAVMIGADCLVLLSDVDGLYTGNPAGGGTVRHIPEVREVNALIEAMAGDPGGLGKGGMVTKLAAAKLALQGGCHMAIADGRVLGPVTSLDGGAKATWFVAQESPSAARKQWIAGTLKAHGALHVDAGAARALATGKSLLPAGVTQTTGKFEKGDAVRVLGPEGNELARGLVAYGHDDTGRIIGHNSADIENILGYRGRDVLIHRDDLVLMG